MLGRCLSNNLIKNMIIVAKPAVTRVAPTTNVVDVSSKLNVSRQQLPAAPEWALEYSMALNFMHDVLHSSTVQIYCRVVFFVVITQN